MACFFYFYTLTLHSKFTTKFCTKYWIKQTKFVPSKRTSLLAAQQTSTAKLSEAVVQKCSVEKVFLDISPNSQENTCARASFLIKLTLTQVFSCEFCKISKITLSTEQLRWLLQNYLHIRKNFKTQCSL